MGLKNVTIPDVNDIWDGKTITNKNIELINDTYCFDIHNNQTKMFANDWPFVATGDRIRKLLPDFLNVTKKLKGDGLIFCGNRNDLTGMFQKLERYTFSNLDYLISSHIPNNITNYWKCKQSAVFENLNNQLTLEI